MANTAAPNRCQIEKLSFHIPSRQSKNPRSTAYQRGMQPGQNFRIARTFSSAWLGEAYSLNSVHPGPGSNVERCCEGSGQLRRCLAWPPCKGPLTVVKQVMLHEPAYEKHDA